ncbi:uncharacterized protein TNCV_1527111 [Trichonephila clavipes]|nr:uncharacterized protein TNCV_1527111 [Trichonephila clavipes]
MFAEGYTECHKESPHHLIRNVRENRYREVGSEKPYNSVSQTAVANVSFNKSMWHELCDICAVLLEPQLLVIMIVQFRNEKVSNHGSIPIAIDCNVVAFIVFEEEFHRPIKRTKHDEAKFWFNGYVNKQNYRIWSEANPQVYVEIPLHPEKLTVWSALWAGGIIGLYFFKTDDGHNVTVTGDRYRAMITNFPIPELNKS